MNKTRLFLVIAVLVMATLACNAVTGGAKPSTEAPASGGSDSGGGSDNSGGGSSGGSLSGNNSPFPMPASVSNLTNVGGTVNFQTSLSLKDAMAFYQDAMSKKGYTERTALTSTSDTTFSMVFDGDPSGKAVVVQGVDLGGGKTNVNIRLEDVP